jgi:WD40 repeat protein
MADSFKYVFVETNASWVIGSSSHHFLSFSSDGTTIAGTKKGHKKITSSICEPDQVQFWETATGAATFSFEHSSFVVFSPTDPNIAVLVRKESIHIVKRDSFGGKTWGGHYRHQCPGAVAVFTFNSDGKTIALSWLPFGRHTGKDLGEYNVTTGSKLKISSSFDYGITSVVRCPIKPGWFVVGGEGGELEVVSSPSVFTRDTMPFMSHCRLTPVYPASVSACAWSQDGKWIATGNSAGDTFLWNAGNPASLSFAMHLPRNLNQPETTWRTSGTTSIAFLPDNSALIIISGGYLSVWDIENAEYVANSGLPDTAMNIVLDGPRNRLAVAANERITIYELRLAEQVRQMDGKPSTPSELAEFDITNAVVKFDPEPLVGVYFDIHRGACKFETPRIFQLVVAIKVLRPSFKARDDAHEQQEFEDVRKLNFVPLDMQY